MNTSQRPKVAGGKSNTANVRVAGSENDERDAADTQVEYRGLCSTCKHASTCTFPRNEDRPVHCCEEFDGEVKEPVPTVVAHREVVNEETLADREKYLGLCSVCAKRNTCTFPKPESGVWQCEEFE